MIPPVPDLRERIQKATAHGLARGALLPLPTRYDIVDGFIVRVLESLSRKDAAKRAEVLAAKKTGERPNPFLPPEEDLFVGDVSPTHFGVLNKFNVLDDHLLVVTREFVDQQTLLDESDLDALWRCLLALDGLAFYNGGEVAGASQPHRHLQLVSLPLVPDVSPLPIERLLELGTALPFRYAFDRLEGDVDVAQTLALYRDQLSRVGLAPDGPKQAGPYNLLVTRRWMLTVPRRREHFEKMSVNALGFAGALLVRSEAELGRVREVGPLEILRHVGVPVTH